MKGINNKHESNKEMYMNVNAINGIHVNVIV